MAMTILKMTDICKDYVQGKEPVRVLKNVNLEVQEGDYIAIMGPSGSGKSTLMNIIGCLDVPTSGEYELNGKNLRNLKDDDLADVRNKYIGFVFQSFYLMPKMEAVDNVALPLLYAEVPLKERRQRAEEALKAVGLEERIHFLPNQMSGGQMQRVAIARALVNDPDILLADEPTGALDSETSVQVMEILKNISKDRLHSDGSKLIYPTFVNIGEQPAVEGTHDLFTIKLKTRKACKPSFKFSNLMMVDKFLRVKSEK